MTESKPRRGRPRKDKPLTVAQRVRRYRLRQEKRNEEHMKSLMAIVKDMQ
jgi:hypothetical protein